MVISFVHLTSFLMNRGQSPQERKGDSPQLPTLSNRTSGFTLVEMLIAIVLISLLTLVIAKILITNTRVFTKNTVNSAFQTDARLTLRYLTKDFKSATRIEVPEIGPGSNNLSIRVNINGVNQTVNYGLNAGNLSRSVGGQNTRLARRLVNTPNTLFTRTSQNSLRLKMEFGDPAMKPRVDFTFEATLNIKSAVVLSLEPADGINANLNSVHFLNQNQGWAVGTGGIILNYDNGWNSLPPAANTLNSVRMLSDSLGYIASNSGKVLRYDGNNWISQDSATSNDLYDVSPTDINNIYAVGGNANGVINYFDSAWKDEPASGSSYPVFRSFAQRLSDKYAVGNSGSVYKQQTVSIGGGGGDLSLDAGWSMTPGYIYMRDIEIYADKLYLSSAWDNIKEYNITVTGGIATGRNFDGWFVSSFEIDDNYLYLIKNASLEKYNFSTGAFLTSVNPGGDPNEGLAVGNSYIYVTAFNTDSVYRFDLNLADKTGFISVNDPRAVEVDTARKQVYVTSAGVSIRVYDLATGTYKSISWSLSNIADLELDKYGYLWAVPRDSNVIYRINPSNNEIKSYSSGLTSGSWGIAIDSQQRIYAAEYKTDSTGKIKRLNQINQQPGTEELRWLPVIGSPFGTQNLNGSSIVNKQNSVLNYFLWVVGNGGTILRYDSESTTWTPFPSPANANLNSVNFFNENNGYAVGANGTILRYSNGSFEQLEPPQGAENANLKGVFLYGNNGGWIVGDGGTRIKIGEF